MANKVKRVSINAFEKYVEANRNDAVIEKKIGEMDVVIKTRLTLTEMLTFADAVVNGCFSGKDGTYMPELKDFLIQYNIIEHYTNIALPANAKQRYELLLGCGNLFAEIYSVIDQRQYGAMIDAIDEKIAYVTDTHASEMSMEFRKLITAFGEIEKDLSTAFRDVDGNSVQKLFDVMAERDVDEAKIAKAVLEYQDSKNKTGE